MDMSDIADAVFEAKFENWRRWCILKGMYQAQAGSLEGSYSGPQGHGHPTGWGDWDQAAPPVTKERVVINVPDAVAVNRAFVSLASLAPYHAQVIKTLVFKPFLRETRQAQILGTHYQRLGELLRRAKLMLKNQLQAQ